jgi:hemoglobin
MTPEREIYVPPQGPPQGSGPSPEIYTLMGEENIYAMLEEFYSLLATSSIREMFPADSPEEMKEASRKSGDFFIFILGGPPLYHQKHGNPMMRKRHMAFLIDENARNVWLATFKKVLETAPDKYQFPRQHLPGFLTFLEEFSAWMVNTK